MVLSKLFTAQSGAWCKRHRQARRSWFKRHAQAGLLFALVLTICTDLFAKAPPPNTHASAIPHRDIFHRSLSDVSGDIFLLTQPGSYLLDPGDFESSAMHGSHISSKHDGKVDLVLPPHPLSMHGFAWDYDLRIPLAFYDPSGRWFKAGIYPAIAVQQDIVPTLADVLGIPPPDRAEGRVLSEARVKSGVAPPRLVAVIVQDQMGLQYFAAHPNRAPFIRSVMRKGAFFSKAQVAHVDVETSVGHAAIGTGAYPRGHHVTANMSWHTGLWSASPVFSAKLTETLSSDAYPFTYDAATLADVWVKLGKGRPNVLSFVSAARASLALGGHGSLFQDGKKTSVLYMQERGPDAGTFVTNESFYRLPSSVKGRRVDPYAAAFQKEMGGQWFDHKLIDENDRLAAGLTRASPAEVRFESDLVEAAIDELKLGQSGTTDLLFVNFKSSDYCGHYFGYESEECGDVLTAVDSAVKRVVDKINGLTNGDFVVVYTADHGAAPLPELSGAVRYDRGLLRAKLNERFMMQNSSLEVVPFISSSQLWLNRPALKAAGYKVEDVVKYLKEFEVPLAEPWNMLAKEWAAKGKGKTQRLFYDVVSRDEL